MPENRDWNFDYIRKILVQFLAINGSLVPATKCSYQVRQSDTVNISPYQISWYQEMDFGVYDINLITLRCIRSYLIQLWLNFV